MTNKKSTKKIKICMLLPFYYEEGMKIVPQVGFASYLNKMDCNVTWVLLSKNISDLRKKTIDGIKSFFIPNKYNKNKFFIFSILVNIFRRFFFTIALFEKGNFDVLFIRDDLVNALIGLIISRKYDIPLIYQIPNPLNQSLIIGSLDSKGTVYHEIRYRFDCVIMRYILQKANLVLPTTEDAKTYFLKFGVDKNNMFSFPNGIKPQRFSKNHINPLNKIYKKNNTRIILYLGAINKIRNLELLIKSFEVITKKTDNVKLLLVGDGDNRTELEKLSRKLNIKDRVIFTGNVDFSEVPSFIGLADICVSPIPPYDFYKLSSPIKLFEYMAAAKPIVANSEIPEQWNAINESKGGMLVRFDQKEFTDAILLLMENPEKAKKMGNKGKEWVMKNRTYEILAKRFEKRCVELIRTEC